MNGELIGILVGIATGSIMILINAIVRRVKIQTRTDRIAEDVEDLKKGHRITLKAILPLLLAAQGQKPNGEITDALRSLNEYLTEK